jgi:hypothetical protein
MDQLSDEDLAGWLATYDDVDEGACSPQERALLSLLREVKERRDGGSPEKTKSPVEDVTTEALSA